MKTKSILSTSILAMLCTAATASALTMETVTIGNPGNPNDSTGYGGVSDTYAIGKYEVTLNQYREFLAAVAVTDTYGLYNASMGTDLNSRGITQTGSSGSYAYAVIGDGNRPVTYVSWYDAARFSNWLSNGQPTGLQTVGTTETGSYTLTGNTGLISYNGTGLYRLPSESQWYKAAYYQPLAEGGDTDGYWQYPTGSNGIPNSRNGSASDANSGNFFRSVLPNPDGVNDGYAVSGSTSYSSSQQYLTPVGAYTLADSYYGTFDQGGNVYEWNDAIISSSRGLRGGLWNGLEDSLLPSARGNGDTTFEGNNVGFRIATVPEPTVSVSLMLAGGGCCFLGGRDPLRFSAAGACPARKGAWQSADPAHRPRAVRTEGLQRAESRREKPFDGLDSAFDALDLAFDALDLAFDALDSAFDALDSAFDALDLAFDAMDSAFDALDSASDALDLASDGLTSASDGLD